MERIGLLVNYNGARILTSSRKPFDGVIDCGVYKIVNKVNI